MDLFLDKTIVEGDILRRKRFLKKESIVSFSDVSRVEIHKDGLEITWLFIKMKKKLCLYG